MGARPRIDRVEPLPVWPGVRDDVEARAVSRDRERFLERMRAERFDIALQLHGGGRHSNPLVRALSARVTAGPRTPDAPTLEWIPFTYWQHEVLRYLEIVALVGPNRSAWSPSST